MYEQGRFGLEATRPISAIVRGVDGYDYGEAVESERPKRQYEVHPLCRNER